MGDHVGLLVELVDGVGVKVGDKKEVNYENELVDLVARCTNYRLDHAYE
jgi:hypothetical protein